MKRLAALFVGFILTVTLCGDVTKVGGSGVTKVGGSGVTKVSPVATGYTLFYNGLAGTSGGNWPIGDSTNDTYAGLANWSDASGRNIGKAVVKMEKTSGSITGKTYYLKIWAQGAGNNLGSLLATSDAVTGSDSWSGTNVTFIFSTPYLTTGSTVYHFTCDAGTADVSNYGSAYFTTDALSGSLAWWDNTGASTTLLTGFDFQVDLYTTP